MVQVTGSLTSGAHPGGLNGQDAYTGQLVVESKVIGTIGPTFGSKNYSNHQEVMQGSLVVMDKLASPDTPRA